MISNRLVIWLRTDSSFSIKITSWFSATSHIKAGKNITSNLPCEIYTTDGTLTLNTIEHVRSAIFTDHQGNQVQLPIQQAHHTMTEEVAAFAHMIQQPDLNLYQTWLEDASSVHELLYTMRQTAGIRFEAEK